MTVPRSLKVVAVSLGLVAGLASPARAYTIAPSSARAEATCRGLVADHVVQPGEDWVGTNDDDVVVVVGPDAEVWTNYGNDLVCVHLEAGSHYGGSKIYTSYGNDTAITYGGSNDIYSGADRDYVYLNGEHEYADLDSGNDVAYANGSAAADIDAGEGNDYIVASPGGDFVMGDLGDDIIRGSAGIDVLLGSDGNDELHGGTGYDHVDGGAHWDSCLDAEGAEGADISNCESVFLSPAIGGVVAG